MIATALPAAGEAAWVASSRAGRVDGTAALPLLRRSVSDPLMRESFGEEAADIGPSEDIPVTGLGDESTPAIKRTMGPGAEHIAPGGNYIYIWRVHNVALRLEGAADSTNVSSSGSRRESRLE